MHKRIELVIELLGGEDFALMAINGMGDAKQTGKGNVPSRHWLPVLVEPILL